MYLIELFQIIVLKNTLKIFMMRTGNPLDIILKIGIMYIQMG